MVETFPLRWSIAVALIALVPVVAFLADRLAPTVALSFVSVLVIATSLYWMFGPATDAQAQAH